MLSPGRLKERPLFLLLKNRTHVGFLKFGGPRPTDLHALCQELHHSMTLMAMQDQRSVNQQRNENREVGEHRTTANK